jgi:capsular polysaccharide biosynthesis protein
VRTAAPEEPVPAVAEPPPVAPTIPALPHADVLPGRRRRRIAGGLLLVILAVSLGAVAGAFVAYYQYTRPALYRSTAVLLIDEERAIAASPNEGVLAKLSRLRAKYAGIVGTTVFATAVAERTGLPPSAVNGSLIAGVDPTSLLLRISAGSRSRDRAHLLAQSAAEELVSYVDNEQSSADIPPELRVSFTIVSPAAGAVQVAPNHRRAELVGVFVFAVITVAGLLGADFLRRYRRN